MPRLFVAVDIPERIKDDIADLYCAISGVRWIDEEQIHITLRFIGEVDNPTQNRIIDSLNTIRQPSFNLSLKGVGHFPPRKEPRILWVGITNSEDLLRLQSKVERGVNVIGIEPEKRKFHPHLTIGRVNNSPEQKIAQFLASNNLFATESFEVSEFHLYTSILRKEGALYQRCATFKLRGN